MTQITEALYQDIAEAYADVYDTLQIVENGAQTALHALVDVTTTGYSPGAAAAVEIELALLSPLDIAHTAMTNVVNNTAELLAAVRALNSHVINNTSGSDTATIKLKNWINSTMGVNAYWPDGAPNGWAQLSSSAGYDISGWNINVS